MNSKSAVLEAVRQLSPIGEERILELNNEHVVIAASKYSDLSDLGNGKRFSNQYHCKLRYCYENATWYIWNGVIWKPDKKGEIYLFAKEMVEKGYLVPSVVSDEAERKKVAAWAKQCECLSKRNTMIEDAKPELAMVAEEFDKDINKITCLNNTIDLSTLNVYEPEQRDFITKQMKVKYDERAGCPRWLQLLKLVFDGDKALIEYFQQAVGYALVGDTSAECMFLLLGSGENGKSTIVRTLATMFGDYAYKTPVDTLIAIQGANKKPSLAHLKGVRFLYASESEYGDKLSMAMIKELTGGEAITGCHKYEKEITFLPQCTLFFSSNNEPIITGTDHGTWRRIVKIPFTVKISDKVSVLIPKEAVIAELEKELSGIFNWALDGLRMYRQEFLRNKPQAVLEATATYKNDQDTLNEFLQDRCIISNGDKTVTTPVAEIFTAYETWANEEKETPITKHHLSKELKLKGFEQGRTGQVRRWYGIRLREKE